MSVQCTRPLLAYCSGIIPRPHNVLVSVDHNAIYNQLSVPKLDDIFVNTIAPIRTITIRFIASNNFFVVYYHDPKPLDGMLQILVFRKSKFSDRLVNLRHADGNHLAIIRRRVARFVRNIPNAPLTPAPERIITVKSVLAFYFGNNMNTGVVPIATDHVRVNGGFSVPRLTGWLSSSPSMTTSTVTINVPGNNPPSTFVIFCTQYDIRHAPSGIDTCKLLIFRKGFIGDNLVSLRATDKQHVHKILDKFFGNVH